MASSLADALGRYPVGRQCRECINLPVLQRSARRPKLTVPESENPNLKGCLASEQMPPKTVQTALPAYGTVRSTEAACAHKSVTSFQLEGAEELPGRTRRRAV
jgi:hypothetical protein